MYSLTILGAYGSKSVKGGSSAFLVNPQTTIDAGNLLEPLEEKNANITTIWLTHSHLDHISDIAFILDNYYEQRKETLVLKGLKETLSVLEKHFLNYKIWPDFSKIPLNKSTNMTLIYQTIQLNRNYKIDEKMSIMPFKTDHTVPSCGYIISKENHAVLISADTHDLTSVIQEVEADACIKTLVIECSFPSSMLALAIKSKHLTPTLLFEGLEPLEGMGIKLYINHIKPSYEKKIKDEIEEMKRTWDVEILKDGDSVFF